MSVKKRPQALAGCKAVALVINLPGPVAAWHLTQMGAEVTKLEPGTGDSLAHACQPFYRHLTAGMEVERLSKEGAGSRLQELLAEADIFITSTRLSAVARLGVEWTQLNNSYPKLVAVAISGYADQPEIAGHDLNYQAECGLLDGRNNPETLLADMSGALQVRAKVLELMLVRRATGMGQQAIVSLAESAAQMAWPKNYGMTGAQALLGGGFPFYRVYPTRDGLLAVALLEQKFLDRFFAAIGRELVTDSDMERFFATRSAEQWQSWARKLDLPINRVR